MSLVWYANSQLLGDLGAACWEGCTVHQRLPESVRRRWCGVGCVIQPARVSPKIVSFRKYPASDRACIGAAQSGTEGVASFTG